MVQSLSFGIVSYAKDQGKQSTMVVNANKITLRWNSWLVQYRVRPQYTRPSWSFKTNWCIYITFTQDTVWCHVQDLCKPTFEVVSDTSICVTPPPSPSPPMHVRDTCSACAAKSCVHTRDNYSLTDWFIFHTVAGMSYAKSLHERKVTFINSVVPATKS